MNGFPLDLDRPDGILSHRRCSVPAITTQRRNGPDLVRGWLGSRTDHAGNGPSHARCMMVKNDRISFGLKCPQRLSSDWIKHKVLGYKHAEVFLGLEYLADAEVERLQLIRSIMKDPGKFEELKADPHSARMFLLQAVDAVKEESTRRLMLQMARTLGIRLFDKMMELDGYKTRLSEALSSFVKEERWLQDHLAEVRRCADSGKAGKKAATTC